MTPLPKYFAKSKTRLGTVRYLTRRESTGKSAPSMEVAMMTKTDAIRSPVLSLALPVNVHSSESDIVASGPSASREIRRVFVRLGVEKIQLKES